MARASIEQVGQAGSPVVFLPGLGWPGVAGRSLADSWVPELRTYLVDLPGMGRSAGLSGRTLGLEEMGGWVLHVLDELGLQSAHLAGHSMGAAMAVAAARCSPERARSLVLLDGGYRKVPRFPAEAGPLRFLVPLMDRVDLLIATRPAGVPRAGDATRPAGARGSAGGRRSGRAELAYREQSQALERLRRGRPDIRLVPADWGHYVHWAPRSIAPAAKEFMMGAEGCSQGV
ncbi:MAG: alpha/beta fold hydrolase [Acidimicrobiales bacterium]